MTNNAAAPLYSLRGLPLIGWRDMSHALNYLFADGQLKQGTLVAINAEKLLTAEDNPEVRALIGAAEFKYADGISVVRSIRKKFPQAQVSRVAGADLWEALMRARGKKAHRYFLSAASLRCWRRRKQNCGRSGTSILWVARMVTLRRSASGAICAYPCQRRENCHRRDGIAKTGITHARLSGSASPCVIYGGGRDL